MQKNALRAKMALLGDNYNELANFLGIASTTLSNKINETNGSEFTQGEITKIKERYSLSPTEIDYIFFNEKVSYKDTKNNATRYT